MFWNDDLTVCPLECFRPVGLQFDQLGRLWVSSDATGEVYILSNSSSEVGIPGEAPRG